MVNSSDTERRALLHSIIKIENGQPLGMKIHTWGGRGAIISQIDPGTLASKDSSLAVGRAIVEVNGTNMIGKPYDYVLETLRNAVKSGELKVSTTDPLSLGDKYGISPVPDVPFIRSVQLDRQKFDIIGIKVQSRTLDETKDMDPSKVKQIHQITYVHESGACFATGNVHVDDVLVGVNGYASMVDVNHEAVVAQLSDKNMTTLHLVDLGDYDQVVQALDTSPSTSIVPDLDSMSDDTVAATSPNGHSNGSNDGYIETPGTDTTSTANIDRNIRILNVERPASCSLGVVFTSSKSGVGVTVLSITPGSVWDKSGDTREGDFILAIDSIIAETMDVVQVIDTLDDAGESFNVVVASSPTPSKSPEASNDDLSLEPTVSENDKEVERSTYTLEKESREDRLNKAAAVREQEEDEFEKLFQEKGVEALGFEDSTPVKPKQTNDTSAATELQKSNNKPGSQAVKADDSDTEAEDGDFVESPSKTVSLSKDSSDLVITASEHLSDEKGMGTESKLTHVELPVTTGVPLGLHLVSTPDKRGARVAHVVDGSEAHKSDKVKVGAVVAKVNGEDVLDREHGYICDKISSTPGSVTISTISADKLPPSTLPVSDSLMTKTISRHFSKSSVPPNVPFAQSELFISSPEPLDVLDDVKAKITTRYIARGQDEKIGVRISSRVNGKGARVSHILDGGAASRANPPIKVGSVIARIDNVNMLDKSHAEILQAVAKTSSNGLQLCTIDAQYLQRVPVDDKNLMTEAGVVIESPFPKRDKKQYLVNKDDASTPVPTIRNRSSPSPFKLIRSNTKPMLSLPADGIQSEVHTLNRNDRKSFGITLYSGDDVVGPRVKASNGPEAEFNNHVIVEIGGKVVLNDSHDEIIEHISSIKDDNVIMVTVPENQVHLLGATPSQEIDLLPESEFDDYVVMGAPPNGLPSLRYSPAKNMLGLAGFPWEYREALEGITRELVEKVASAAPEDWSQLSYSDRLEVLRILIRDRFAPTAAQISEADPNVNDPESVARRATARASKPSKAILESQNIPATSPSESFLDSEEEEEEGRGEAISPYRSAELVQSTTKAGPSINEIDDYDFTDSEDDDNSTAADPHDTASPTHKVKLPRSPPTQPLGLQLYTNPGEAGPRIQDIDSNSASAAAGDALKEHDCIVSVNGQDLRRLSITEVVGILNKTEGDLELEVHRDEGEEGSVHSVTFPNAAGLQLTEGSSPGLFIAGVSHLNNPQACDGDRVVAINGVCVVGANWETGTELLQRTDGPVTLEIIPSRRNFQTDVWEVFVATARGALLKVPSSKSGLGLEIANDPHDVVQARVIDVAPKSVAESVGLVPGDAILAINGRSVIRTPFRQIVEQMAASSLDGFICLFGRHHEYDEGQATTVASSSRDNNNISHSTDSSSNKSYKDIKSEDTMVPEDQDSHSQLVHVTDILHHLGFELEEVLVPISRSIEGSIGLQIYADEGVTGCLVGAITERLQSQGLRMRDHIVSIDGQNVSDADVEDVMKIFAKTGKRIKLVVSRVRHEELQSPTKIKAAIQRATVSKMKGSKGGTPRVWR